MYLFEVKYKNGNHGPVKVSADTLEEAEGEMRMRNDIAEYTFTGKE